MTLAQVGAITSENVINYLPYQADGFVVLNDLRNPDVVKWKVIVKERGEDATGGVTFTKVYTKASKTKNYFKIPEKYLTDNHFIKVKGKNDVDDVILNSDLFPIGPGPHRYTACSKYCVGGTYAYKLDLSVNEGNSNSFVRVKSAVHPTTGEYFYQYMSPSQFNSSPQTTYYNVPCWSPYCTGIGTKIIKLNNVVSGDGYVDENNNTLTGTVYAVRKFLGDWQGSPLLESNELAAGPSLCAQTTAFFINQVNAGADFAGRPLLSCNGSAFGQNSPPASGTSVVAAFDDCYEEVQAWIDNPSTPFTMLSDIADCMEASTAQVGGSDPYWPEFISGMTIKPYNNPGGNTQPVILSKDDFYTPTGEFMPPSITINKGLNILGFQIRGGGYRSFFFEAAQTKTYRYGQSNLLKAKILPVPIMNDKFRLRLKATADVTFIYRLLDFTGKELYSEEMTVIAGDASVRLIKPSAGIPSGQLINRFEFLDGSKIVIQSLKP
jgi:hypothetical protein